MNLFDLSLFDFLVAFMVLMASVGIVVRLIGRVEFPIMSILQSTILKRMPGRQRCIFEQLESLLFYFCVFIPSYFVAPPQSLFPWIGENIWECIFFYIWLTAILFFFRWLLKLPLFLKQKREAAESLPYSTEREKE